MTVLIIGMFIIILSSDTIFSSERNPYNPYSYGSPSPPYGSENNMGLVYYDNTYEHQRPQKKKRHH